MRGNLVLHELRKPYAFLNPSVIMYVSRAYAAAATAEDKQSILQEVTLQEHEDTFSAMAHVCGGLCFGGATIIFLNSPLLMGASLGYTVWHTFDLVRMQKHYKIIRATCGVEEEKKD
jgi:hypothetical protein